MQVEEVTLGILKEVDLLSDTRGNNLPKLATMYVRTLAFLDLTDRNIKAFFERSRASKKVCKKH